MDKRTDLLAAGRKRLQQYRQKKDTKGSKSGGSKSGKSGGASSKQGDSVREGKKSIDDTVNSSDSLSKDENLQSDVTESPTKSLSKREKSIENSTVETSIDDDPSLMSEPAELEGLKILVEDETFTKKESEKSQKAKDDSSLNESRIVEVQKDPVLVEMEEVMSESSKENFQDSLSADVDVMGSETFVDVSEKEDLGSKMVNMSTGSGTSFVITMSELADVVRKLDQEEVQFLCTSRESPLLERLKEQLYLTTCAKDTLDLQLIEELEIQSLTINSLDEVRGKNQNLAQELTQCKVQLEDLEKEFNSSKAQVEQSSDRVNELTKELEISQADLLGLSSKLEALQLENENLLRNLQLVSEEKEQVLAEKKDLVLENERLESELSHLQAENVNLSDKVMFLEEEKSKISEEMKHFVFESDKLVAELADSKSMVETLQLETAKLNELLSEERLKIDHESDKVASESINCSVLVEALKMEISSVKNRLEEEKFYVSNENEKLSHELSDSKTEYVKVVNELKEATLRNEQLIEENVNLISNLEIHKAKITESDDQIKDSTVASSVNEGFKGHIKEVDSIIQKLEEAIEKMHSDIASSGISIEAFESKEHESGEMDLFKLSNEQILNLKALLQKLLFTNSAVSELNAWYKSLKDHSDHLEEANIELMTFSEALRQHIFDVEAKEGELISLFEASQKQEGVLKSESSELKLKLSEVEGKISDLQSQLDEAYQRSDAINGQNEHANGMLHKIYNDLVKCVIESGGSVEENLIDPQAIGVFDTLIQQVETFLREKSVLESEKSKLSAELIDKAREVDELNKKSVTSDSKNDESTDFLGKIDHLSFLLIQHENEIVVLEECLKSAKDAIILIQSELEEKNSEIVQSEQRVLSLREKLSMAVTKGKGLIVQRDSLKKSLQEISNDLEKCKQELQAKDARTNELELKLNAYMEAGERMEALESELSYIRNSATGLRESFLLKDSVLQRIEEILEDLELPEHFHSGDIIDKVDWLAKSVSGNTDWDHKSGGAGSYSDSGLRGIDGNNSQPNLHTNDEYRSRYEEIQSKFYALAEQNEMLEQSLMERNNLVQQWEEIIDRIDVPSQLRSMEPVDRIEWLMVALSEAHNHCNFLQQKIDSVETSSASLMADFEESQRRIAELDMEKETLVKDFESLTREYDEMSKKVNQYEIDNGNLKQHVSSLRGYEERVEYLEGEMSKFRDLVTGVLEDSDAEDRDYEGLLRKLLEKYSVLKLVETVKEGLSKDLESLTRDYDEVSKKVSQFEFDNGKLKEELSSLQESLDLKRVSEERVEYFEGEIRKFRDLVTGVLEEDYGAEDDSIEYFEGLLRKLLQKAMENEDLKDTEEKVALLNKKLDDSLTELMHLKEERDLNMEKNRSLVTKVEELETKVKEMQEKLIHEEQKSVELMHLKEERDINMETNNSLLRKVEELETKVKEMQEKIVHEEQKFAELMHLKEERDVNLETNQSLVRKVEELEAKVKEMQEQIVHEEQKCASIKEKLNVAVRKGKSLVQQRDSMKQFIEETNAEVERLKSLVAQHESTISEYDNKLKDLGTLQERVVALESENTFVKDSLQEKERTFAMFLNSLGQIDVNISDPVLKLEEIGKALVNSQQESIKSKRAAELLLAELNEVQERNDTLQEEVLEVVKERDNYLREVKEVKTSSNELRNELVSLDKLLGDVLFKDLETIRNLEACLNSCMKLNNAPNMDSLLTRVNHGGIMSSESANKEIGSIKEKLYTHPDLLHKECSHLAGILRSVHTNMSSQNEYCESLKREINRFESIENEKDSELVKIQRNFSSLCEACTSSISEIEKFANVNGFATGENIDSQNIEESFYAEEGVKALIKKLSSSVKDLISMQSEAFEVNQKDTKSIISNLQKELQEKEIQSERNCMELVGQIKEAEAVSKNYLQELQLVQARVENLQKEASMLHENRILLEKSSKDLQELELRNKSLTDTLAAKEQENEALLQALDEEEGEMEELRNKNGELQKVVEEKNEELEKLEISRQKVIKKLSVTVGKFDELHNLSENLLAEVEKLQSQLTERDSEISFLRQEVTRCTNDALVTSQKINPDDQVLSEFLTWLDTIISRVEGNNDGEKPNDIDEYKEILMSGISELEDLRMLVQSEKAKVEELRWKEQNLETSLRDKESQLSMMRGDSGHSTSTSSEIVEVDPMINKWTSSGSVAPQVRSLRKTNNDHVAVAIDVGPTTERLEEEDDDKSHGFKSLTTSRIVPRFTRPVTNIVDGLWVSCDRALMRQPALRLGVILYWAFLHALIATYVV